MRKTYRFPKTDFDNDNDHVCDARTKLIETLFPGSTHTWEPDGDEVVLTINEVD